MPKLVLLLSVQSFCCNCLKTAIDIGVTKIDIFGRSLYATTIQPVKDFRPSNFGKQQLLNMSRVSMFYISHSVFIRSVKGAEIRCLTKFGHLLYIIYIYRCPYVIL